MRNSEGYHDPTAGKAMSSNPREERQAVIVAPKRKPQHKARKASKQKKETKYFATPVYTSK